ncbi:MAG: MFS transporter [Metallosphaera sp.]
MEEPLKEYEEKKLNSFHIKTMLIAGAGQIVDGYDLTAAALVTTPLMEYFGSSLLTLSTSLFASIISGNILGALIFGYLARHGRKRFYGVDAILMTLGALLQAFVSSPYQLVFLRFLLGLGIGADYVLSPLVAAEYANRKDRGKILGISGGVMWNVGALISAVVTLALGYFLPSDILWRAVLALGCVPAISVIIFRRRYPETPHYLLFIKRDLKELGERDTSKDISKIIPFYPLISMIGDRFSPNFASSTIPFHSSSIGDSLLINSTHSLLGNVEFKLFKIRDEPLGVIYRFF